MLELVVVLSVFLVIFAVTGWFVVVRLQNENKNLLSKVSGLETTNADLKKQLDDLMNKPSMIGLSYKTNKENINTILENVQKVYLEFQTEGCKGIKTNFTAANKDAFKASVTTLSANATNCNNMATTYATPINTLVNAIAPINANITEAQLSVLRKYLTDLIVSVMNAVCKDGAIDTTKLMEVLTDVLDAACFMN